MTITKLGHCCLVIETNGVRIMTDPGAWTTAQTGVRDLDAILITHEHPDHFHVDSLRVVLQNNPTAHVFTNAGVGKILKAQGIPFELLGHQQSTLVKGISLEGHGEHHAGIYKTVPQVINTGYMVDGTFFYPGDAFFPPEKPVEILALPVAGPWMRIADAIDYALAVRPKRCFPVHDGMIKTTPPFHLFIEKTRAICAEALQTKNITFVSVKDGEALVGP